MKSTEIRRVFLEYFEERGHRVVPGSSLVPNDPTLFLTSAGMVQFKPYFLGEEEPPFRRAASVQKCLRTTDIDSVGRTARHNTFFEMLGNFSFGDYYKAEAIPWAWELVTGVLGIDPEMLWMSVFEEDDEAETIWKDIPGVSPGRVIRLGADDNFWDMGATGPCGPCSEILYDRGEKYACGPYCRAGCDCDRFLELWNLVFMQYDRAEDKTLTPLPRKNIDTGMGLERVAAIKQGVDTIFETDLVSPVVGSLGELTGLGLGDSPETDVSIKVVSDHARASAFLIADGVIPSNEGRGYVLRRLIRRAVRHGRTLGAKGKFLDGLSEVVIEVLGDVYPELKEHHRLITGVIGAEEERFGQTLEQGMELLSHLIVDHRQTGSRLIEGRTVFYLHDTLGFPLEVTEEIAREHGLEVDRKGFEELMDEQRERARASREAEEEGCREVLSGVCREKGATGFLGYECARAESVITALLVGGELVEEAKDGQDVEVVLAQTPFYAESGGQVGDSGVIRASGGTIEVSDTRYGAPGLIVHQGRLAGYVRAGETVEAVVDLPRRMDIARNHSATHILHWALRKVLGTHVRQSGSLVTPERLRFDFTHYRPVGAGELEEVERLANLKVLEDVPVEAKLNTRGEALAGGAIALFGEKYGEDVRVVEMGDFSKELCGGIHVERSGRIGPVRIVSESGIGAGLRRIEATTGLATLDYYKRQEKVVREASGLLKVDSEQLSGRVAEILNRLRELEREAAGQASLAMEKGAERVMEEGETLECGGTRVFFGRAGEIDQRALRDLADTAMRKGSFGVVSMASEAGGTVQLVVKVDRALVERGLDARKIAAAGGKVLGGGGGGRPDMAVAGGGKAEGLDDAFLEVRRVIEESLGAVS